MIRSVELRLGGAPVIEPNLFREKEHPLRAPCPIHATIRQIDATLLIIRITNDTEP